MNGEKYSVMKGTKPNIFYHVRCKRSILTSHEAVKNAQGILHTTSYIQTYYMKNSVCSKDGANIFQISTATSEPLFDPVTAVSDSSLLSSVHQ